jgi:uncharacterized membrane protein YadS
VSSEGISSLWKKEDWWAVWIGFAILLAATTGMVSSAPKLSSWESNPLGLFEVAKEGEPVRTVYLSTVMLWVGLGASFSVAVTAMGGKVGAFLAGYTVVFLLSIVANLFGNQAHMEALDLGYAFWALAIGLLIANTIGTPKWLLAGAKTELFIKTGLVLLGAEILFNKMLKLGAPGLLVAWVVTPIVVVSMYWFGVRVLKMSNRALVIVVATATSVCGVSAAIAAAAACRAKKEDLTLAVGMSLIFTVLMMIAMPALVVALGIDLLVGGAWLGGTIDATGAVVAAGAVLGKEAETVAAVVKMIQNILIGVIAFAIAVYWVTYIEKDPASSTKPSLKEVWIRFPKFILGFIGASILFSAVLVPILGETAVEKEILKPVTGVVRGWLFCLAFVSIGLESNFKELSSQLVGGKPIILYIVGQTFNIAITLLAAYLAFGGVLFDLSKVFPG